MISQILRCGRRLPVHIGETLDFSGGGRGTPDSRLEATAGSTGRSPRCCIGRRGDCHTAASDTEKLRKHVVRTRQINDHECSKMGLNGLEALRRHAFDAVITDVHMPGRGGLWLWNEALALRPELRGKFIFMSSEPLPEPPSGAVFMVKPFSLATLQSAASFEERTVRRFQLARPTSRLLVRSLGSRADGSRLPHSARTTVQACAVSE
jgi:CheY-like chemotaxis protein